MLSSSPLNGGTETPVKSTRDTVDGCYAFSPSPGTIASSSYLSAMDRLEEFSCQVPTKGLFAAMEQTSEELANASNGHHAHTMNTRPTKSPIRSSSVSHDGHCSHSPVAPPQAARESTISVLASLSNTGEAKHWVDGIPISPIHAARTPVRREKPASVRPHPPYLNGTSQRAAAASSSSSALPAETAGLRHEGGAQHSTATGTPHGLDGDVAALRFNLHALLQQAGASAATKDAGGATGNGHPISSTTSSNRSVPNALPPPLSPHLSRQATPEEILARGISSSSGNGVGNFNSADPSMHYTAVWPSQLPLQSSTRGDGAAAVDGSAAPRQPASVSYASSGTAQRSRRDARERMAAQNSFLHYPPSTQLYTLSMSDDPIMRAIATGHPQRDEGFHSADNDRSNAERSRSRLRQEVRLARAQQDFDAQADELARRLDGKLELVFALMRRIMVLDARQTLAGEEGESDRAAGTPSASARASHSPSVDGEELRSDLVLQLEAGEDEAVACTLGYVELTNRHALQWMNEGLFSAALQLLRRADGLLRKDAGRVFRYLPDPLELRAALFRSIDGTNTASLRHTVREGEDEDEGRDVSYGSGGRSDTVSGASKDQVRSINVPFIPPSQEPARLKAAAAVEHNLGIYHFKIGEYAIAISRFERAAVLEEELRAPGIGITYFNLAQAQHELRDLPAALHCVRLAEEAVERQVFVAKDAATQVRRRLAQHRAFTVADIPEDPLVAMGAEAEAVLSTLSTSTVGASASEAATGPVLRRFQRTSAGSASATELPRSQPTQERELLQLWMRWREGVCFMSCVKQVHAEWLNEMGQYRAAYHQYEQAHRWLESVPRLAPEEQRRAQRLKESMANTKRRWQREEVEMEMYHRPLSRPAAAASRATAPSRVSAASAAAAAARRSASSSAGAAARDAQHPYGRQLHQPSQQQRGSRSLGCGTGGLHSRRGSTSPLQSTVVTSVLPHAVEMAGVRRGASRLPAQPPPHPVRLAYGSQPRESAVTSSTAIAHSPLSVAGRRSRPNSANAALYSAYMSRPSPSQPRSRRPSHEAVADGLPVHITHPPAAPDARPAWDASAPVPVPPQAERRRPSRPTSGTSSWRGSAAASLHRASDSDGVAALSIVGAAESVVAEPASSAMLAQDTRRAVEPSPESHSLPRSQSSTPEEHPLPCEDSAAVAPAAPEGVVRSLLFDVGAAETPHRTPPRLHTPPSQPIAAVLPTPEVSAQVRITENAELSEEEEASEPDGQTIRAGEEVSAVPAAAAADEKEDGDSSVGTQQRGEDYSALDHEGGEEKDTEGVEVSALSSAPLSSSAAAVDEGVVSSTAAAARAPPPQRRPGDLTWCVVVVQTYLRCRPLAEPVHAAHPPVATLGKVEEDPLTELRTCMEESERAPGPSIASVHQAEAERSDKESEDDDIDAAVTAHTIAEEDSTHEPAAVAVEAVTEALLETEVEEVAAELVAQTHLSEQHSTEVVPAQQLREVLPMPVAIPATLLSSGCVVADSESSVRGSRSFNKSSGAAVPESAHSDDCRSSESNRHAEENEGTNGVEGRRAEKPQQYSETVLDPEVKKEEPNASHPAAAAELEEPLPATAQAADISQDAADDSAAENKSSVGAAPVSEVGESAPPAEMTGSDALDNDAGGLRFQEAGKLSMPGATEYEGAVCAEAVERQRVAAPEPDAHPVSHVQTAAVPERRTAAGPPSEAAAVTTIAIAAPETGVDAVVHESDFADAATCRSLLVSHDSGNESSLDRRSFLSADALVEPEEEDEEENDGEEASSFVSASSNSYGSASSSGSSSDEHREEASADASRVEPPEEATAVSAAAIATATCGAGQQSETAQEVEGHVTKVERNATYSPDSLLFDTSSRRLKSNSSGHDTMPPPAAAAAETEESECDDVDRRDGDGVHARRREGSLGCSVGEDDATRGDSGCDRETEEEEAKQTAAGTSVHVTQLQTSEAREGDVHGNHPLLSLDEAASLQHGATRDVVDADAAVTPFSPPLHECITSAHESGNFAGEEDAADAVDADEEADGEAGRAKQAAASLADSLQSSTAAKVSQAVATMRASSTASVVVAAPSEAGEHREECHTSSPEVSEKGLVSQKEAHSLAPAENDAVPPVTAVGELAGQPPPSSMSTVFLAPAMAASRQPLHPDSLEESPAEVHLLSGSTSSWSTGHSEGLGEAAGDARGTRAEDAVTAANAVNTAAAAAAPLSSAVEAALEARRKDQELRISRAATAYVDGDDAGNFTYIHRETPPSKPAKESGAVVAKSLLTGSAAAAVLSVVGGVASAAVEKMMVPAQSVVSVSPPPAAVVEVVHEPLPAAAAEAPHTALLADGVDADSPCGKTAAGPHNAPVTHEEDEHPALLTVERLATREGHNNVDDLNNSGNAFKLSRSHQSHCAASVVEVPPTAKSDKCEDPLRGEDAAAGHQRREDGTDEVVTETTSSQSSESAARAPHLAHSLRDRASPAATHDGHAKAPATAAVVVVKSPERICQPPATPAPRRARVFVFAPPRVTTPAPVELTHLVGTPQSHGEDVEQGHLHDAAADSGTASGAAAGAFGASGNHIVRPRAPGTPPTCAFRFGFTEEEGARSLAHLSPSLTTGSTDAPLSFTEYFYCEVTPEEAATRRNGSSNSTATQLSQLRASFWRSLHDRGEIKMEDGMLRSSRSPVKHVLNASVSSQLIAAASRAGISVTSVAPSAVLASVVAAAALATAATAADSPAEDTHHDTSTGELRAFQQQLITHHGIDIAGDADAPPFRMRTRSSPDSTAERTLAVNTASTVAGVSRASVSTHPANVHLTPPPPPPPHLTPAEAPATQEAREAEEEGGDEQKREKAESPPSLLVLPSSPPELPVEAAEEVEGESQERSQAEAELDILPPLTSDNAAAEVAVDRGEEAALAGEEDEEEEDATALRVDDHSSYHNGIEKDKEEANVAEAEAGGVVDDAAPPSSGTQSDKNEASDHPQPQQPPLPPPPPPPPANARPELLASPPVLHMGVPESVDASQSPTKVLTSHGEDGTSVDEANAEEEERRYIRSQILREEAATVIQLAWRRCVAMRRPQRTYTMW